MNLKSLLFTVSLSLTLFIAGDLGAKDFSPGMPVPSKGLVTLVDVGAKSCIPCKMMGWFFLIWLPDYFKKTRGLLIKQSWVHLVTIYAIVTDLYWTPGAAGLGA